MDLKDFNNSKIEIENNSFLLLSSHRNDYFKEYSEKISSDNPNYQGYILSDLFLSEQLVNFVPFLHDGHLEDVPHSFPASTGRYLPIPLIMLFVGTRL